MAYSARPVKDFLQVFDALTGAPYFSIHLGSRELSSFFMNGNTLTVTYKSGTTEVWNLTKRQKVR